MHGQQNVKNSYSMHHRAACSCGTYQGKDEYLFVGKITTLYQVRKIENDDRVWLIINEKFGII